MNDHKLYIVYMPRLAGALREMGFKIIKVSPNIKKPQYDVYWFEDTSSLHAAIPIAKERAKQF